MANKKKIGIKLALIAVIAAAAAGGGWYWYSHRTAEINYKTVAVERGDLRSVIQATGTLNPVETVDVGTQISGTIKSIYFDYNSKVKAGQLIAVIDDETQRAEVAQSAATLQSSLADIADMKAALNVAAKNLKRTRELSQKDLIAKSDLDADESAYLQAKAQLSASQSKADQYRAALEKSKINLGNTRIYSPVNGVVVAKNVEEGQTVAASYQTPSIAEIARDLTQMQVEVDVDEADIGGVKTGQNAIFNVDTFPDDNFKGKVTQVRLSPTTTDNVVTYTVIVKVSNPDQKLLPGMTANVSIIQENRENILMVPNSAFRFKPIDTTAKADMGPGPGGPRDNVAKVTKPTVYVLDNKKQPQKIEVEKGISDGRETEITKGVKEGQRVITGIIVPKEDK